MSWKFCIMAAIASLAAALLFSWLDNMTRAEHTILFFIFYWGIVNLRK